MKIETDNYKRISTVAKIKGKTTVWIQRLVKENKLESILIDKTIFIKVK